MVERWSVDLEKRVAAHLAQEPLPFVGDGTRPVWSIDTPPPYPSGRWHIGAVAGYSLIDMLARSRRMLGYDVLFPWGTDRNGINIEFTVEKASGKPMRMWDRAQFNDACREAISAYSEDMKRIGRRIGLSCDFDKGYETDAPDYRAFSQSQFLKLFMEGLVVEDLRPNTYDPKLGTTIADAEVFYEERKTRLNHVTWTVKETGEAITISTTRPELICACRAVLVHPDNEATKHLIGKTAVLPIDREAATGAGSAADAADGGADARGGASADGGASANGGASADGGASANGGASADRGADAHGGASADGGAGAEGGGSGSGGGRSRAAGQRQHLPNEVPIRAHPHVKADFGSGIMMVCSYGDQADVQLFRELDLEPIAAIGMDGRMTEVAGKYTGMKVEEARKAIIEDLEAEGKIPSHDVVDQKFPISERSKAPVETISLREWYVKQTHATDDLRRIAKEMDFVPAKHRQLLLDWIDTVSIDWPISRRRYYHTEIPLWNLVHDGEETEYVVVPPFEAEAKEHTYFRPWQEDPPAGSRVVHRATRVEQGRLEDFLAAHPKLSVQGETKVFDTWMDSSVSHLFILKDWRDRPWWDDHTCSLRVNGRDIVRTWLYYACLKNHLLRGAAPFEHAVVHGMGMDKHGRKMSKSLGNVVDPDSIIDKHGADAFRLWIAGECTIGDDFRIDEQKIQGTGKFLQKLGNVVNFVSRFPQVERPDRLHPADGWILAELDAVTQKVTAGYTSLDLFGPANQVRSFVWNLFAPHYLEMVKGRAYGDEANGVPPDPAACWTLHEVVRRVLLLLAPLVPFMTHHLATEVYGMQVHRERLPEPLGLSADPALTEAVVEFNSRVWKAKQDAGISLAQPIAGMEVPDVLRPMEDVLAAMHKLETPVEAEGAASGRSAG